MFNFDKIFPEDMEDSFGYLKQQLMRPFRKGFWKGTPIKDLPLGWLLNAITFAKRTKDYKFKVPELEAELARRDTSRFAVNKVCFYIPEEMILELAVSKGFKIPRSGAGVYIRVGSSGKEVRMASGMIAVKYDITQKLKPKETDNGTTSTAQERQRGFSFGKQRKHGRKGAL